MTYHHHLLPEELKPYRKAVRSAVIRVRERVAGADTLPVQDLYQEAWLVAHRDHRRWEVEAHNLNAYARSNLFLALANQVRATLRERGGYGTADGKWTALQPTIDPDRRGRNPATTRVGRLYAEPTHGPLVPVLDGPEDVAGIYGRSPRWARTFRRTFPEAAEAFLAVDDRVQSTLPAREFTRRKDSARAKLRAKYAWEIETTDAIEERREDQRLIRAMFGDVAA